ncbi:MAG: hypothetical protein HW403_997 [Dehalococcoidia bacterium]|nr:hypothetical protein [Dehalococcoidia bacterium]
MKAYREMGEDWERLKKAYHWLSDVQLRAAIAYWKAYPGDIEERLRDEERWTPEKVKETYPFTAPQPS